MIRLRFEHVAQVFKNDADAVIVPLNEITKKLAEEYGNRLYAEIPAIVWEGKIESVKEQLKMVKSFGVENVVAENIGAIGMAKELGLTVHAGMTLNILNSISVSEYEKLGATDVTMSFELSFAKLRKIEHSIPIGIVGYGYMPLMKLRACPARDENGCGNCSGHQVLKDRMNEEFMLMCHERQYSELLNCVPIYVADKNVPSVDFETLFFTIETKLEAEEIFNQYKLKESPGFRRTAGLYFRELQ